MNVILNKKIKNPTIIEAFPGIGLIGSITTEYLISHLDCEEVGQIIIDKLVPIVAVHEGRLIKPVSLYYNKKNNLLIIHTISSVKGIEWELGEAVFEIIKKTQPKQIISLDGIGSVEKDKKDNRVFYYVNSKRLDSVLAKIGLVPLKESIILGVTATIMSRIDKKFIGLFAETSIDLPDSRAAAKIIKALDSYLGLDVNYKPLIKKAEMFENNLKDIMDKGKDLVDLQENKQINYFG